MKISWSKFNLVDGLESRDWAAGTLRWPLDADAVEVRIGYLM